MIVSFTSASVASVFCPFSKPSDFFSDCDISLDGTSSTFSTLDRLLSFGSTVSFVSSSTSFINGVDVDLEAPETSMSSLSFSLDSAPASSFGSSETAVKTLSFIAIDLELSFSFPSATPSVATVGLPGLGTFTGISWVSDALVPPLTMSLAAEGALSSLSFSPSSTSAAFPSVSSASAFSAPSLSEASSSASSFSDSLPGPSSFVDSFWRLGC